MSLNQAGMYALSTILPYLATTTLLARMRVRLLQKANFQIDDWLALGGLVVCWAVAALIITGTAENVFGTHTVQDPETGESSITHYDRENVEYMWITLIISIFSISLIKLSVVFLYRRIFTISRAFNIYSWVLIGLIVAWTVAFLGSNIFQCGAHPTAAWSSAKQIIRYCDNIDGATAALALTDLIMDLMILIALMPIVWQLQMTLTQKVQVTGIFALGYLSAAASAVRAYILLFDAYGTTLSYRDVRGENTKVVAWTLVEIAASLIGCCLPTLRSLFANTSLGSFLGSLFSVISLHSRRSSIRQEKEEEKLAVVTIGGSDWKQLVRSAQGSKASSLSLKDVGRLA